MNDRIDEEILSPEALEGEEAALAQILPAEETLVSLARDWKRRVFVNRDLRLDHTEAIGFDMDFTLAVYKGDEIQKLTYDLTLARLIEETGYPAALGAMTYEPSTVLRGLVLDKRHGNLLKINQFNHCLRAFHGVKPVSQGKRLDLYRSLKIDLASRDFAWLDTLFCLPEGCLYGQLVSALDKEDGTLDYARLYEDVRGAMDAVHADVEFKRSLGRNLERFVERDPLLSIALHRFRSAGKKLFILTNSRWEYTNRVMGHLLEGYLEPYADWQDYFDYVMVDARKPVFFNERRPFTRPDIDPALLERKPELETKVMKGGNIQDFEELSDLRGDTILYVGDHIYGDMLRSKKTSLWRTAMIIPELDHEIETTSNHKEDFAQLDELAERRRELDHAVNYHRAIVKSLERVEKQREDDPLLKKTLKSALHRLRRLRSELNQVVHEEKELDEMVDLQFNERWGPLFRDGHEKSRFWHQVEKYACIYTSRVSNFCYYSPVRYFRPPRGMMPHEPVQTKRSWFS